MFLCFKGFGRNEFLHVCYVPHFVVAIRVLKYDSVFILLDDCAELLAFAFSLTCVHHVAFVCLLLFVHDYAFFENFHDHESKCG